LEKQFNLAKENLREIGSLNAILMYAILIYTLIIIVTILQYKLIPFAWKVSIDIFILSLPLAVIFQALKGIEDTKKEFLNIKEKFREAYREFYKHPEENIQINRFSIMDDTYFSDIIKKRSHFLANINIKL
jgi:hypothetical protein